MIKRIDLEGYHLRFDTETGLMARWGKTPDDDPQLCPIGPEIADIEISTVCHGIGKTWATRRPCPWCYKSNTGTGENMNIGKFRTILSKFPSSLTQIAFGIGDLDSNEDLYRILHECRLNGIVPNLTTNGMGIDEVWDYDPTAAGGPTYAMMLAETCGAVAVSHYGDDDLCFGAVDSLSRAGLKQVNIHKLLSADTLGDCHRLIDAAASDPRLLGKLKAIVFLLLKPKGKRNRLRPISGTETYKLILDHAERAGVAVGMDSCSAPMALRSLPPAALPSVEPCESGLFSIYVNVKGELFPCSFTEGTPGWERGIDLASVEDFGRDVWSSERLAAWRSRLLESSAGCSGCALRGHCRSCPTYPEITVCKGEDCLP